MSTWLCPACMTLTGPTNAPCPKCGSSVELAIIATAAPRREDAAGERDDKFTPDGYPRTDAVNAEFNATMDLHRDVQRLRARLAEATAALSTAERDAKRWRFARTILHVVSTGPSGGYYLTSDVADGMDVQAVSPDGFVDQFAAARVPSGGET